MEIKTTRYSDVIKIRAHHLLCMQGFQGYGYTRKFQRNMERIIHYLKSYPHSEIKVVADADIICESCPHLENGRCNRNLNSQSIKSIDLKVLKKLEIEEGQIGQARNLFCQVNERFNNLKERDNICGSCSWKDKCLWYLSIPFDY